MEWSFDPHIPFYHGTVDLYSNLIMSSGIKVFSRSKGGVDFGPGFYLTSNFTQAKKWAERRAEKMIIPHKEVLNNLNMTINDFLRLKKTVKPIVMEYKINSKTKWKSLNNKIFKEAKSEWRRFVWTMRKANKPLRQLNYDWIYGPVADGGIYSSFYDEVQAYTHMDQLAVISKEAVNLLSLEEVIPCQS